MNFRALSNQRGRCARSAVHQGPLTVRILLAVRIAVIARERRDRTRSEEKPSLHAPMDPLILNTLAGSQWRAVSVQSPKIAKIAVIAKSAKIEGNRRTFAFIQAKSDGCIRSG